MEKIIVELEAKTDKALKGIDGVAKSVEQLNKEVTKSNKDTVKGLKGVESASKSVSKGLKSVGTGLKALGIGLVIASLSTLKDLFSQNQKVVDTFNIVFETAAQVVGQVSTAFTDIYKSLSQSTEQFDALGKVASGIVTIALTPFKNAFYAIQLAVQSTQLAWEKSVFGDKDPETIEALNKSILETKVNIIEVGNAASQAGLDVVNNFGEAISEVAEASKVVTKELGEISVSAAVKAATANIDLQKSAELAAATQGLLFEKFDRQAEKLRQIRDEERNSLEDRKKANDELLIKINEAEQGMLREAKMQLTLANANLKKDKNNTEFKVAQIEALKEVAAVEAQIEGIRSEQKANDLALDRESIELTKSITESESILSVERKRFNAELIDDELLKLEKLKEIDLLFQEKEILRLENLVNVANLGTQAKVDAQIVLDTFMEESRQTNLTREKEITEQEIALSKRKIQNKAQVVNAISQFASAEGGIGKALLIVKQGLALQETIMDLKRITFKGIEAVGSASVSTAQNVAESSKIGFPQNLITIAGAIAQGVGIIGSVKKAVSKTKASAGAGAAASLPSVASPSIPSLPPAFNVVGQSDTNQLADAIGGQSKAPQRAYVVSGDVSTSQELDRNIVTGASI
jgi:hypothetical protein